MGRFMYGDMPSDSYRMDDRTLAHVELAISAQLRLGNAFPFTLDGEHVPAGRGRHVLWLHPSIPIQFRYQADRRAIRINPRWVSSMSMSAGGDYGLRITAEPPPTETTPAPLYG